MNKEQLKRHMQVLYHRCIKMLRDPELAWDALQEIMTRYYEAVQRRNILNPYHYLQRACTNHCLDLIAKRKKISSLQAPEMLLQFQQAEQDHTAEGKLVVSTLLKEFEKEDVALLMFRYMDQMTYREIAAIYNKSDRGIQKRLDRLEIAVRDYLQKESRA